jgi:pilus assembly protein Flp/PilA
VRIAGEKHFKDALIAFAVTSHVSRQGAGENGDWRDKQQGVTQLEASMKNTISRFVRDESGVTAIEYGLIAALIAVAIITIVTTLGSSLSATFTTVNSGLTGG